MAVPKKHHTSSRVRRRRSHLALKKSDLTPCPRCQTDKPSHRYCPSCGFYKDKEVVDVLASLSRKEKKERQKELDRKE